MMLGYKKGDLGKKAPQIQVGPYHVYPSHKGIDVSGIVPFAQYFDSREHPSQGIGCPSRGHVETISFPIFAMDIPTW